MAVINPDMCTFLSPQNQKNHTCPDHGVYQNDDGTNNGQSSFCSSGQGWVLASNWLLSATETYFLSSTKQQQQKELLFYLSEESLGSFPYFLGVGRLLNK